MNKTEVEVLLNEKKTNRVVNVILHSLILIVLCIVTIIFSCAEISCFKVLLDKTKEEGALLVVFLYYIIHWVVSKITWEIQNRRSHHLENYSEYLVPDHLSQVIAFIGCIYYGMICLMTPHLQSTHLVLLMQSSCVFACLFLFLQKIIGWSWVRTCQLLLGLTSMILILYTLVEFLMVSLFVNRSQCCRMVIISTILSLLAVILNSYNISLTSHTLLKYPSMQTQFEMNIYKYQIFISPVLMYVLYIIRNPSRFEVVDLFVYLRDIIHGFAVTFIHSWNWVYFVVYMLAGFLYDILFAKLVVYTKPVCTSVVQVLSFLLSLTIMWFYEDYHETPTHDIFTIISFVLFSALMYWEGVSLPVFRTHRGSFFENKREVPASPV